MKVGIWRPGGIVVYGVVFKLSRTLEAATDVKWSIIETLKASQSNQGE